MSDEISARRKWGERLQRGGRWLSRPAGVATIASLAVLLTLLADQPGTALVLASLTGPAVLAAWMPGLDVYEREPLWGLLFAGGWGWAVGVVISTLSGLAFERLWVDGLSLHFGAAGFAGPEIDGNRSPSLGTVLLLGLLLPVSGTLISAAGPFGLRRFRAFRNEAMDGFILGAMAGAGYAAASTLVALTPFIVDGTTPAFSVGDWSGMLLGLLITRPIIFALSLACICASTWRYTIQSQLLKTLPTFVLGVAAVAAFSVTNLLIQSSGVRWEVMIQVIWSGCLGALAFAVVRDARAFDQALLSGSADKIVCPRCCTITITAQFCARCGAQLPRVDAARTSPEPA